MLAAFLLGLEVEVQASVEGPSQLAALVPALSLAQVQELFSSSVSFSF